MFEGLPLGSVLGPIFSIVYIDVIDLNLSSYMFKINDEAIFFSEVSSLDEVAISSFYVPHNDTKLPTSQYVL